MQSTLVEIYRRVLENPSEENRLKLVEAFLKDLEGSVKALSRFIGGERVPDTVVATLSVENVIAGLVLSKLSGRRVLRVIIPRRPVPGWGPLNLLVEELSTREMIHVYRTEFYPSGRLHARSIVREVARLARGISAKDVDITDASPSVIGGLYAGGVRGFLVLVYHGYSAVYQYFTFTAAL